MCVCVCVCVCVCACVCVLMCVHGRGSAAGVYVCWCVDVCAWQGGCWVVRHPPGPRTALAELGVARVCAAHLPQPCDPQKTLFPGGVTERAEGGSTQ